MSPRLGTVAVVVGAMGSACGLGTGGDLAGGEGAERTAAPTAEATPQTPGSPTVDDPSPTGDFQPVAAEDPAGLAAQIQSAEDALRDPATAPEDLEGWAHLQQVTYRRLGDHPEWDRAVLAGLTPELRAAARLHGAARREFVGLADDPPRNVPAWRIVDPAPAEDLLAFYQEGEDAFGVPWEYLAAINLVETGMGRIVGLSTAGAVGPMQFLPTTWERWGEGDISDPRDSIVSAARYLAGSGAPEDLAGALWSYNNHNNYVRGVTDYAQILEADPDAFAALHRWQIYYRSAEGDLWFPVGYNQPEPIPVTEYLASQPSTSIG